MSHHGAAEGGGDAEAGEHVCRDPHDRSLRHALGARQGAGRRDDGGSGPAAMGYYGHSELGGGTLLKKIIFVMLLILVGVGAFFAWKMLKGDGGCCGWGGDNTDPWSSYTPPAEPRRLRRPSLI